MFLIALIFPDLVQPVSGKPYQSLEWVVISLLPETLVEMIE
jgi:hypothetical protein